MKNRIIFTGGGSGGHLFPALTLIDEIRDRKIGLTIDYIGSTNGIEREMTREKNITYHPIETGKLRRYLSFQNVLDIFKLVQGIIQSIKILYKIKKDSNNCILFSTGGFVSVPPAIAAKILFIPVLMHEQTSKLGLANKITAQFASEIYISFKSTAALLPIDKTILSGNPVRKELFDPLPSEFKIDNFTIIPRKKKLLFITGGGNGAKLLNDAILNCIDELSAKFIIVHQAGKDHLAKFQALQNESYLPLAFTKDMVTLLKTADIIVSRAGAGTVAELMALNKPSIFIPLKIAQKNEQFFNALEAKQQIGSTIIEEDELKSTDMKTIINLFIDSKLTMAKEESIPINQAVDIIISGICNHLTNDQ